MLELKQGSNPHIGAIVWVRRETFEGENKMAEEQVDMEYISLHGYIRNTPSDTVAHAEHQLRADRWT